MAASSLSLRDLIQSPFPTLRRYSRGRRGRKFLDFLAAFPRPVRILDLGGTVEFWLRWGVREGDGLLITLVNNHAFDIEHRHTGAVPSFITDMDADALTLPASVYAAHDVVFSNSFIEHLFGWDQQATLARAVVGSGRPYFIQTPNKFAPIDPHFPALYAPFQAAYPRRLRAALWTVLEMGAGERPPSYAEAYRQLGYYNALSTRQMRRLFPDAAVILERPFGVPMSILAYRRGPANPPDTPGRTDTSGPTAVSPG
jgi:hypothetical protein